MEEGEVDMSEFHIKVVEVGLIEKHPNADTLGITKVYDYPVIVRLGDFLPGDRAVYLPVDSMVPTDRDPFRFLASKGRVVERIQAKRLRGVFSMGILVPAPANAPIGMDVREALGVTKYEPPEPSTTGGDNEKDPGFLPVYTDIEGLRRWPDILIPGEEVVISEKIHGANGRWLCWEGRLWVGSHTGIKRETPESIWWQVASQYNLAKKLPAGIAVYGEVFGQVRDMKYGVEEQGHVRAVMFDALDIHTRKYLNFDTFRILLDQLDIPLVPTLYRGPWSPDLASLAEGTSAMADAHHVREGVVIRPVLERWSDNIGRVILKRHGEGYLTRKNK